MKDGSTEDFCNGAKNFRYIKGNKTFLEKEPLVSISKIKQLVAYKHYGFWQCMDTIRDKELLEKNFKI